MGTDLWRVDVDNRGDSWVELCLSALGLDAMEHRGCSPGFALQLLIDAAPADAPQSALTQLREAGLSDPPAAAAVAATHIASARVHRVQGARMWLRVEVNDPALITSVAPGAAFDSRAVCSEPDAWRPDGDFDEGLALPTDAQVVESTTEGPSVEWARGDREQKLADIVHDAVPEVACGDLELGEAILVKDYGGAERGFVVLPEGGTSKIVRHLGPMIGQLLQTFGPPLLEVEWIEWNPDDVRMSVRTALHPIDVSELHVDDAEIHYLSPGESTDSRGRSVPAAVRAAVVARIAGRPVVGHRTRASYDAAVNP